MNLPGKSICTGCHACFSICPASSISMREDAEGFLYPEINNRLCTKCSLCENICPVLVQGDERKPLRVYAAKNQDEQIRFESSSGGMFTLLSEAIILQGGVVFGARFNEKWEVIHDYTETVKGLTVFRGSKYVQSVIGDTYKHAKRFLESGRMVLFSGTPCQIAGLKAFLKNDYDNLLTVDLVCHGVPSPAVWRKYLDEVVEKMCPPPPPIIETRLDYIKTINFRDKTFGWQIFGFLIQFAIEAAMTNRNIIGTINFREKHRGWKKSGAAIHSFKYGITEHGDIFVKGFLRNLYLRPACYECKSRSLKSGSDITLGDYWGIQNILPDFDDDKGVSLVMINSDKGRRIFCQLQCIAVETDYDSAFAGNQSIERSPVMPVKRIVFFRKWHKINIIPLINTLTKVTAWGRMRRVMVIIIERIGLLPLLKSLLKRQ
jgi:coenzyme F420-reducing hydrogenase beta subunit